MEESRIEFYYAGKMMVVRCDSTTLAGDIRRGLLIDTETSSVNSVLYIHDELLNEGWRFGCTDDCAEVKLMKMLTASMYGKMGA